MESITKISSEQKCWVVRADSGKYYNDFKKNSLVAIGHLDFMGYDSINQFLDSIEDTLEDVTNYLIKERAMKKKEAKSIASKSVHQAKHFSESIAVDDYVLTMGQGNILVGKICDDAYIDKKPLVSYKESKNGEDYEQKMEWIIRREVDWIAEIPNKKAPYALKRLLVSPLTVFNIKSPNIVYHSIYPIFMHNENKLHFSIYINSENDINNSKMLHLLESLSGLECLTNNKECNHAELNKTIDDSQLNIKASFMSPGEIFAFLPIMEGMNLGMFYFAYSFLFGNKILGIDGLVSKEARDYLIKTGWDEYLKNKKEKVVKTLDIKEPSFKLKH